MGGFMGEKDKRSQYKNTVPSNSKMRFEVLRRDDFKYIGNLIDGKYVGLGTLQTANFKYIGHFKEGFFDEDGKISYTDHPKILDYCGNFKEGKFDGTGRLNYKNGTYYDGEFKNGEINGQGKITYEDGSYYEGQFVNGKRDGAGKVYKNNKIIQKGEWQEDSFYSGAAYISNNPNLDSDIIALCEIW